MRPSVLTTADLGVLVVLLALAALALLDTAGNTPPPARPRAEEGAQLSFLADAQRHSRVEGERAFASHREALKENPDRGNPPPEPGHLVIAAVDPLGTPVRDARVTLRLGLLTEEAVTGMGGEATFPEIPAGSYALSIAAPSRPELDFPWRIMLATSESKRVTVRVGDFDRSVFGHVLDDRGNPAPGIEVEAKRHLFQHDDGAVVHKAEDTPRGVTDAEGFFEITGLEDGDYDLRTVPSDRYGPARTTAHAGSEPVCLTVRGIESLKVRGRIRTRYGAPLAGVVVTSSGQNLRQTGSLADGSYDLELLLDGPSGFYTMKFARDGFRTVDWRLPPDEVGQERDRWVDVQMEPTGAKMRVAGTVQTVDGVPVEGERLVLTSRTLRSRHQSVSGASGRFVFRDVEVGTDYHLSVRPEGDYQDFSQIGVIVSQMAPELRVVLKPLEMSRVRGVMVDPSGNPILGASLWARSSRARGKAFPVVGDGSGSFDVAGIPAGELSFETRSVPRLTVRGVKLAPGVEEELQIALDLGNVEVAGLVTDAYGAPLGGARVTLVWTHREGEVRSGSHRQVVADGSGRFLFAGVGRAPHELRVSAPGYTPETGDVDASRSGDIVMRLTRAAPKGLQDR